MLNSLDLFSGIGGISYALQDYVRPIAYCEIDEYCRQVLSKLFDEGQLTRAPIYNDVKELLPGGMDFDIITAGFPCQDISSAGRGEGLGGERSGLFFEIIRLVKEANPPWVFLENVPAIRTRGLTKVIEAFSDLGYDCRWTCVSAKEVGACHIRKRWFMLAHSHSHKLRLQSGWGDETRPEEAREPRNKGAKGLGANSNGAGLERHSRSEPPLAQPCGYGGQISEPSLCRGAHGLSHRVDRIKTLGNAVVPAQCKLAFERLAGF